MKALINMLWVQQQKIVMLKRKKKKKNWTFTDLFLRNKFYIFFFSY